MRTKERENARERVSVWRGSPRRPPSSCLFARSTHWLVEEGGGEGRERKSGGVREGETYVSSSAASRHNLQRTEKNKFTVSAAEFCAKALRAAATACKLKMHPLLLRARALLLRCVPLCCCVR